MELKQAVAHTFKWNLIDRVSSQVLYAVTGIVLARMLSDEEFGLVGAILVFQSFAALFVESGFASALLQRKSPTRLDYSTVLWFNLGMAVTLYILLFFLAPFIADIFQGDPRLIPLSRVMFLTFIINALSIVQVNRLTKLMDTRMVAVSNSLGLVAGAVIGIWMSVTGWGAWALVWQAVAISTVKTLTLWLTSEWRPLWKFSWRVLGGFFRVGSGVMLSSLLNTIYLTFGSFFIGHRVSLGSLGYYTQADKWSKMGTASLSQVFTSSFIPMLAGVQDQPERFARLCGKTHRLASYLLFPSMLLLATMATPIFHTLFGQKWDLSILLFQLMLGRGVFVVLSGLYSNFILSMGKARMLVTCELIRDGAALVALLATLPTLTLSTPLSPLEGVQTFLTGQVIASGVAWIVTLTIVARLTRRSVGSYLLDIVPYAILTLLALSGSVLLLTVTKIHPLLLCMLQGVTFIAVYIGANALLHSTIQADVLGYLTKRFKKGQNT